MTMFDNEVAVEEVDANKTSLTHHVTAAVAFYLSARGFKPLETEVPVDRGWIADIAGPWEPTMTELINAKLLRRRPSYKFEKAVAAWQSEWSAIPSLMTGLVEVKTSRSDFTKDKKWLRAIPTNLAYLAVPAGMLRSEEYPAGWGILEYHSQSDLIRAVQLPIIHAVSVEQQRDVIYAVAIKRHHRTEYAVHREWQKRQRIQEGERKKISKLASVIDAVSAVVKGQGTDVEGVLNLHGLKCPHWWREELESLWGITSSERDAQPLKQCTPAEKLDQKNLKALGTGCHNIEEAELRRAEQA